VTVMLGTRVARGSATAPVFGYRAAAGSAIAENRRDQDDDAT